MTFRLLFRRRLLSAVATVPLLPRVAWSADSSAEYFPGEPGSETAPRRALVIGCGDYEALRPLGDNPRNDATAVYNMLQSVGFGVPPPVLDPTKNTIVRALADFTQSLQEAPGLAIIYFAGHGVSAAGRGYIVPKDAAPTKGSELEDWAIPVTRLFRAISAGKPRAAVVILDACRNNPFTTPPTADLVTGTVHEPPSGVYFASSTLDGATASNGVGDHSPFTANLLTFGRLPGLTIDDVFVRIRTALSISEAQLNPSGSVLKGDVRLMMTKEDYDAEKKIFLKGKERKASTFWECYLNLFPVGYFYNNAQLLWKQNRDEEIRDNLTDIEKMRRAQLNGTLLPPDWITPSRIGVAGVQFPYLLQSTGIAQAVRPQPGSLLASMLGRNETNGPPMIAYNLDADHARIVGLGLDAIVKRDQLGNEPTPASAAAIEFSSYEGALDVKATSVAIKRIAGANPAAVAIQASLARGADSSGTAATLNASLEAADALERAGIARNQIRFLPPVQATINSQVLLTPSG